MWNVIGILAILSIANLVLFLYERKKSIELERRLLEEEKKEIMSNFLFSPENPKPLLNKEQILSFAEKLRKEFIQKFNLPKSTTYTELTSYIRNSALDMELKSVLIDFFVRIIKLKYAEKKEGEKELDKLREDAYVILTKLKNLEKEEVKKTK